MVVTINCVQVKQGSARMEGQSLLDVLAETPNGAMIYLAKSLPERLAFPIVNNINESMDFGPTLKEVEALILGE